MLVLISAEASPGSDEALPPAQLLCPGRALASIVVHVGVCTLV